MRKNKLGLVGAGLIALASGCGQQMKTERFGNESFSFVDGQLKEVKIDETTVFCNPDERNRIVEAICYACPYSMIIWGTIDTIIKEISPPIPKYTVQLDWEERYKNFKK